MWEVLRLLRGENLVDSEGLKNMNVSVAVVTLFHIWRQKHDGKHTKVHFTPRRPIKQLDDNNDGVGSYWCLSTA
jgi:hypothetical protein